MNEYSNLFFIRIFVDILVWVAGGVERMRLVRMLNFLASLVIVSAILACTRELERD